MEPHRIEDTVCRTDDGVEKKQLRKFYAADSTYLSLKDYRNTQKNYLFPCSGKRYTV